LSDQVLTSTLGANFQKRSFFDFLQDRQDPDMGASIMFFEDFVWIIRDFGDINLLKSIAAISITHRACDSHAEANQSRFGCSYAATQRKWGRFTRFLSGQGQSSLELA
jgi:hypothetical protein